MSSLQIRDFHCNNCGAPLEIPKNSKGKVVCPSCKTECVIEGLVKNSEILSKENINSGIMLQSEPATLNQRVVEILTSSPAMPLDVLEKAVVTKEEHICVPSYLYYCNASAAFTYEAGNIREHKTAIDRGDYTQVEKEQYMEWSQMSSTASTTATLVASGNREYSDIVRKLYMHLDPNALVDIEDLEYPFDIQTSVYNLPQAAAFNEYVKPYVEKLLEKKAEDSLNGKTYRNISMGGSNVQKDEVIRIFLGFYHIVYEYNNKEYSVYVTGDGKNYVYDDVPTDPERAKILEGMEEKKKNASNSVKSHHGWFIAGMIAFIALGIFVSGWLMIFALPCLICYCVFNSKYKKKLNTVLDPINKEIADFKAQPDVVKQQFIQSGRPLNGIYSDR